MHKWHKQKDQTTKLLNLININGYVLEDVVVSLLKNFPTNQIHSRWVRELNLKNFRERIEIDAWLVVNTRYILCEVKSSSFDWIFLKGPRTEQDFHLLEDSQRGLCVSAITKNGQHPFDSHVTEYAVEIAVHRTENKEEVISQTEKPIHKGYSLPLQPAGREIIHSSICQLFKNTEILIYHEMHKNASSLSPRPTLDHTFLPIIITNAKLYVASYTNEDVNEHANLKSFSALEEVPWLAFNHSQAIRWDKDFSQIARHVGFRDTDLNRDPKYQGTHIKTAFIVQHQKLKEFIDRLG